MFYVLVKSDQFEEYLDYTTGELLQSDYKKSIRLFRVFMAIQRYIDVKEEPAFKFDLCNEYGVRKKVNKWFNHFSTATEKIEIPDFIFNKVLAYGLPAEFDNFLVIPVKEVVASHLLKSRMYYKNN